MVTYQPGGHQEKSSVLKALEAPSEAGSVSEVIQSLRKWLKWKKRAEDIDVKLPDPSILLRGLDKLSGRMLVANPNVQFRVNLTRSQMLIDAVPTLEGVEQLAECLLAEFDQLSYGKKKEGQGGPKIKKLEGAEEKPPPGLKKPEGETKLAPCKFFLTDEGCRKGKGCKWSHDVTDPNGTKRCFTCGSAKHFSNKCPHKTPTASPPKVAKAEKEVEPKGKKGQDEDASSVKAAMGAGDDTRSLLEEAGRMLKATPTSSGGGSSSEDSDARIRSLQRQLDDLKGCSMKVLRLARVQACHEELGLLDSGATHALRPAMPGEDVSKYEKVKINLAGGKMAEMRMAPGKVIVGGQEVEPIVPLGMLVKRLGCALNWTEEHLVISHPEHGQIPTLIKEGCPMVTKRIALELIKELEAEEIGGLFAMKGPELALQEWLDRLVDEHPVFKNVPRRLKEKLRAEPHPGHVLGNRRRSSGRRKEESQRTCTQVQMTASPMPER